MLFSRSEILDLTDFYQILNLRAIHITEHCGQYVKEKYT